MENTIKAVKCAVCGNLHEETSDTFVIANEGKTPDGKAITACYCKGCFGKKRPNTNEQFTKRGLLCG